MRESATPSFWDSLSGRLPVECMYEQLSKASTVDEVVSVTSAYLAGWSRQELDRLPDSCRPARVKGPEDIETWADRLADESQSVALVLEDERRLDRLTSHFLIASVRIRQLAGAPAYPLPLPAATGRRSS